MVEKLSELGAAAFIPLATARSVVLPEGKNKRERWMRIATESAKQSRRIGVMRIDELTTIDSAVKKRLAKETPIGEHSDAGAGNHATANGAWFLATEVPTAIAVRDAVAAVRSPGALTIFVGPEGGWSDGEVSAFVSAGVVPVRLGTSILRIETAAVAVAAMVSFTLV
jgi:16S rRNA (uracil1498-N3)-methyltransferase